MTSKGEILNKKLLSRTQLVTLLADTRAYLIGMEASRGVQHLGIELTAFGNDVRLTPAQVVQPFVSCRRMIASMSKQFGATTRFVPVETQDTLDLQARYRVRDGFVNRKIGVIGQLLSSSGG